MAGYGKNLHTPVAEHFQTWVATPDGMRIHLSEIASRAAGISLIAPWSALDGALKPGDALGRQQLMNLR